MSLVFGSVGCRAGKSELCRDYLAKKAGRDLSAFKAKKQALCAHGTVDDFFRKPNEGPPPAQDLAAAQTTHGNNVHFSRNCYNIGALRDRIPGLCFRLLWTNANELSGLVFGSAGCRTGKSGNFAANIWQKKQAGICRLRRQTTSSLYTDALTIVPKTE